MSNLDESEMEELNKSNIKGATHEQRKLKKKKERQKYMMVKMISDYMNKFLEEMEQKKKKYTLKDNDKNMLESSDDSGNEEQGDNVQISSKESGLDDEDNDEQSEHSLEINFEEEVIRFGKCYI